MTQCSSLRGGNTGSQDFQVWHRNTVTTLKYIFGEESDHLREFRAVRYRPFVYSSRMTDADYKQPYESGLNRAAAILLSMHHEIEEFWRTAGSAGPIDSTTDPPIETDLRPVFVVHGRNGGRKDTVARFLNQLELEPIVLHEQPNDGRTIVEKFEDHSNVAFAVILCTGDDSGSLKGDEENLRSRARQNVILEWGFFHGKLGRDKVCAIFDEGVEIPSDNDGVLRISWDDAGGWRFLLAREMKSAGLPVDLNKIA